MIVAHFGGKNLFFLSKMCNFRTLVTETKSDESMKMAKSKKSVFSLQDV